MTALAALLSLAALGAQAWVIAVVVLHRRTIPTPGWYALLGAAVTMWVRRLTGSISYVEAAAESVSTPLLALLFFDAILGPLGISLALAYGLGRALDG